MFFESQYFGVGKDATDTEYIVSGDEVIMVPIDDAENIIAIWEPSAAFGGEVLVLPGVSMHQGEPLADVANRELQEEIGFRAERLDHLATLRPWAKYLKVQTHVFLARNLIASRLEGDEGYEIKQEPITFDQIANLIQTGKLSDARVIAALYLAQDFVRANP